MTKYSFTWKKASQYILVTLNVDCSKYICFLKPAPLDFDKFTNLIEKMNEGTQPYEITYVRYPNIGREEAYIVKVETDILGTSEIMEMHMYKKRSESKCVIL
ncbi:MAG: hypothetical protein Edafosvirus5_30 [Edafosvirus sp.]|uniref:Uncharacterized protein n=1 Tax=Edafosvirus sp. TaxID=2487765 RepID=A0A3G4ZT88_9VIRU|nr:MAG: hypothetical protein Edafosvirus5_30 [Edafosvirus sp.]